MNILVRKNLAFLSSLPGETIRKPLLPVKDNRTQGDKILDCYNLILMPEDLYIVNSLGLPAVRLADVLSEEAMDYIVMVIRRELDNV